MRSRRFSPESFQSSLGICHLSASLGNLSTPACASSMPLRWALRTGNTAVPGFRLPRIRHDGSGKCVRILSPASRVTVDQYNASVTFLREADESNSSKCDSLSSRSDSNVAYRRRSCASRLRISTKSSCKSGWIVHRPMCLQLQQTPRRER